MERASANTAPHSVHWTGRGRDTGINAGMEEVRPRGSGGNRERTPSEIKHEELDHLNKWICMYAKVIAKRPRLCLFLSGCELGSCNTP